MTNAVIIVGAPRSGTNILRDVLTSVPGFATWPCDEINLLWKHHNRTVPHDELTPEHARPEVRNYLHRRFRAIERHHDADWVVEKTCATSLRVGFAAEVLPDARFVFIRRDGLDAAASTIQRWDAPFDARYVARKLRYAPPSDLPFYAGQFVAKRRAGRRAAKAGRTQASRLVESWWGPKPADFRALQERHPLDELALIQWQRCVEASRGDLARLDPAQVHEVSYEEFVREPAGTVAGLLRFIGSNRTVSADAIASVSPSSVGKGRASFDEDATARLTALGAETLVSLGYA